MKAGMMNPVKKLMLLKCTPVMIHVVQKWERTGKHLTLAHIWTINAIEVGRIRTMALADYGITSMHCTDL
jgi:hypothetical protein